MSAALSTLIDWPTWLMGVGERLAVTTTVGASVAAPEPATSGVGATWARAQAGAQKAANAAVAAERIGFI